MKKKISIWMSLILAGNLLLGGLWPGLGVGSSEVYAASEFSMTTTPVAGATNVPVSSYLKLSFDRQVTPQTGEITLTPQGAATPAVTIPIGSSGLVGSSTEFQIKWAASQQLLSNTTYTATVPKGLFVDSAGAESALTTWSFTTAPETDAAITASEFSPANGGRVDASSLTQLSFKLNRALKVGGGSVKILSSTDNSTVQEFKMKDGETGVSVQSDTSSTTIKLTLTNKLATGSNYYILIDSYAFKDDSNKAYAGISSGTVWNFSTKGTTDIPVTLSPASGATSVSTTTALQLTFDRAMIPASGSIAVSPGTTDDSRTRWLNVNSTSVTGGGTTTITLSPASSSNPLSSGTSYTVTIPQGAFYDQDGNAFPASGSYTWSFTTAALSDITISALSPADQTTSVEVTKSPSLTFNRTVTYNSAVADGVVLYKSTGAKVAMTVQGTTAKNFVIVPTASLDAATTYYVDIAAGAFVDASDSSNVYVGLSGKSSWSFTTASLDKTAPVLSSASLESSQIIRLKYNESLNSAVSLLVSSFAVTVNGESRAINSAYMDGDSVYVELSTGVAVGQVVTISYIGGLRTIQDTSGNSAGTFSSRSVTNSITSSLPVPKEGRVTNKVLTLTFNESLKTVSTYASSQFDVTADGYSLGVSAVRSSGKYLYLTLNSAAENGAIVKVSYYPIDYPLKNTLGQSIAGFSEFYVRNTIDTVAPEFQNATGASDKIVLSYNEAMSTTNLPLISQFSVLVDGTSNYVTDVTVSGNLVTLTLKTALKTSQTVTVSYVPGVEALTDLNGNRASYIDLAPVEVSSGTTVSEISSATVTGNELTVIFNDSMQTSSTVYARQFGVRADESSLGVESYSLDGNVLKLLLSTAVKSGQIVDMSYSSSTGKIKDLDGNVLESFTALSVQNLTGSAITSGRPSYLGTLAASEFGKEYPLLQSDSSAVSTDRSYFNQSVNKYSLNADRVAASYTYLYQSGSSSLAFEVPSSEAAAYVSVPLDPLLTAVNRDTDAELVIRYAYANTLYRVALNDLELESLDDSLIADTGSISLVFRMEKVPTGTYTPIEQTMQTQGMQTITPLTDIRLTASAVSGSYSNAKNLSVPGEYSVRTTSTLNSSQTSAARLDLTYYDAAYLPTQISTAGTYTVIRASMEGNQVVGTFLSTRTFTDMGSHWSNSIVAELAAKNIIDSSYGSEFKPNQSITRAEFAVMLSRGLGLQGDRATAQLFSDVQPSTQTGDYIGAAAKAGIITGNTDGTFRPGNDITREQMAIMMIRAMEYADHPVTLNGTSASTLSPFKDKAKIQSQSEEYVAKAFQEGIILGMSSTEFQPQGNATRAQAAVMLQRMLKIVNYL